MKTLITRNLMLFGLTTFGLMAHAQQRSIDMEIHIDEPADGTVVQSGSLPLLTVSITNHGPDDLVAGDTIFIILPEGLFYPTVLNQPIPNNTKVAVVPAQLELPKVDSITSVDICVRVLDDPSSQVTSGGNSVTFSYIDSNPANNEICHTITIEPEASSIANTGLRTGVIQPYPNPASQVMHIPVDADLNEHVHIRILDLSGKAVLSQSFKAQQQASVEVNVGQLREGIYIVERQQGSIRSTGKITVLR